MSRRSSLHSLPFRSSRWLFALVVAVICSATARAELEWAQRRLLLEPPAGASDAVGVFEFVNRGTRPVRIADVQSGCGCTVAALDQQVVEPGAKGSVRATFHVGDRQGKQVVAVTVRTQEPEARTYDLALEVVIKEFVVVMPRLLYWKVGDDVTGKVFQLSLVNDFRFVSAVSATPEFSTEVVEQTKDSVQVKVTPRDLWAKRNGSITVKVAQPGQPPVEITAMVRVF